MAVTLLLAVSGCAHERPPSEIPANLVDCPPTPGKVQLIFDDNEKLARKETDSNRDGKVDQTVFYTDGKPRSADLDVDYDGKLDFKLVYDEQGRVTSWESLNLARDALPDHIRPPELARVLPYLQEPVDEACVTRPEVASYIYRIRDRMYEKWFVHGDQTGEARLSFSVAADGELLGACLVDASNADLGGSAVRALFRSAPFRSMPTPAQCLAGRRLIGTFTLRRAY